METKEHIFYTGFILATLVSMISYSLDIADNKSFRKLLVILLALIILGGIFLGALGAWIGVAAKLAWIMGRSP